MQPEFPLSNGTRIGSMLLDQIIMAMICMAFSIPMMVQSFSKLFTISHNASPNMGNSGPLYYLGLIGFALYFCKDSIDGRSPGKRITGLQVINNTTGQVASPLKCFVRNIFCIIWPIEVLVTFANPNRRIGDLVAGTKVVRYGPKVVEPPKVDFRKMLVPLALSIGVVFLLSFAMNSMMPSFKPVPYVKNSYNPTESRKLEQLFTDSLGQYMTASIRVYDTVTNQKVKYISVICELKDNYLEDQDNAAAIKKMTLGQLYGRIDKKQFMGQIQYVYKTSGKMVTHRNMIGR